MFHRIVVTAVATTAFRIAAVPVKAEEKKTLPADVQSTGMEHYKRKMSELPLYEPLHALNKPQPVFEEPEVGPIHAAVESFVSIFRKEGQKIVGGLEAQSNKFGNYIETGKAHTMQTIDYLNEPQNVVPRSGAIAVGGVAGFIAAVRGGFIKKVLYTAIGASAVASLCYPREAEHVVRDALLGARRTFNIAYNFAKGIKPGDEEAVDTLSKFPTNLSELQDVVLDLYEDAKEMILPKK